MHNYIIVTYAVQCACHAVQEGTGNRRLDDVMDDAHSYGWRCDDAGRWWCPECVDAGLVPERSGPSRPTEEFDA